jgi:restriction endonuclease
VGLRARSARDYGRAVSAHDEHRQLSLDELPAAAAAPRVTFLAVFFLGAATCALMLLDAAGPYGVLIGPALRLAAWVALFGGLCLAAAAAIEWARAKGDRADSTVRFTRELRELTPERFADWCASRLRAQGYSVIGVAGLSEPGVDLIAEREHERLVIQCKRWFAAWPVDGPQVDELYDAMQREHANGAMVMTTGHFSEPALRKAQGTPIRLWDVDRLMGRAPMAAADLRTDLTAH